MGNGVWLEHSPSPVSHRFRAAGRTAAQGEAAPASSSKVKEAIDAIKAQDYAKAKELLTRPGPGPEGRAGSLLPRGGRAGLGKPAEAIKAYQDALALDPKLTEASLNLSSALLEAGGATVRRRREGREGRLKTAPDSADLMLNLAIALSAAGDFKEPPRRMQGGGEVPRRSEAQARVCTGLGSG